MSETSSLNRRRLLGAYTDIFHTLPVPGDETLNTRTRNSAPNLSFLFSVWTTKEDINVKNFEIYTHYEDETSRTFVPL